MIVGVFDFRPRLIPSIAFFLLLPLLLSLGTWQLNRAAEKQQLMEDRAGRKDSVVIDLNRVGSLTKEDRHKPATAQGRYLGRHQWLLDNRILTGRPGYHVFSLFQLDGVAKQKMLVNRGWVSLGKSRSFLPNVVTPEGSVALQGRMDSPASVGIVLENAQLSDLAPVTVVQHLDLSELSALLGEELLTYALVLDEAQPGLLVRDWRPAKLIMPEKHVGYAVQWYAMAFALILIYVGVNTHRRDDIGIKHDS